MGLLILFICDLIIWFSLQCDPWRCQVSFHNVCNLKVTVTRQRTDKKISFKKKRKKIGEAHIKSFLNENKDRTAKIRFLGQVRGLSEERCVQPSPEKRLGI